MTDQIFRDSKLNVFGVRHLSPGAAYHLINYLDKLNPSCILIEGPVDGNEILKDLANNKVKPPIALLAYTSDLPIETVLYPFSSYSPEYVAICWGIKRKKTVQIGRASCRERV